MFTHFSQGFPVYEPLNDDDLASFHPSRDFEFQFVHCGHREYWIFESGHFLGSARELEDGWQATSEVRGMCVAPLKSLIECARRLSLN